MLFRVTPRTWKRKRSKKEELPAQGLHKGHIYLVYSVDGRQFLIWDPFTDPWGGVPGGSPYHSPKFGQWRWMDSSCFEPVPSLVGEAHHVD